LLICGLTMDFAFAGHDAGGVSDRQVPSGDDGLIWWRCSKPGCAYRVLRPPSWPADERCRKHRLLWPMAPEQAEKPKPKKAAKKHSR
jgi:hypothetical protein